MKKKITFKQIVAVTGIVLLLGLYIVSIVLACLAKPGAANMFMASLVATVLIPIVLYLFLMLDRLAKRNAPKGMSYTEVREYNKRLKNGEDPETLAREIEEKYGIADEAGEEAVDDDSAEEKSAEDSEEPDTEEIG